MWHQLFASLKGELGVAQLRQTPTHPLPKRGVGAVIVVAVGSHQGRHFVAKFCFVKAQ